MAQPIYKSWFARFTDAWYKLSPAEQNALMVKNEESMKKVGAEIIIFCSSLSSEEWSGFGVEKYPSIEAVQQRLQDLNGLNWFMYVQSMTVLGLEMPQT